MLTQEELARALEAEVRRAGSQTHLAEKLGMTQSQISDYLRGRFKIEKMTIGTLFKLFPGARVKLCGESPPEPVAKSLEEQLRRIYRSLSAEEKVRCLSIVIAKYPEKINEERTPIQSGIPEEDF